MGLEGIFSTIGSTLQIRVTVTDVIRVKLLMLGRACTKMGDHGSAVVKVPCYRWEGRWLESRWCHWNFSLT